MHATETIMPSLPELVATNDLALNLPFVITPRSSGDCEVGETDDSNFTQLPLVQLLLVAILVTD